MSHTPGPWIDRHWDNHQQIVITALAFRGPNVLALVRPPLTRENHDDDMEIWQCTAADVAESGANARLIAAAPDLLAACKAVCDWFSADMPKDTALQKCREAITKAEGCQ